MAGLFEFERADDCYPACSAWPARCSTATPTISPAGSRGPSPCATGAPSEQESAKVFFEQGHVAEFTGTEIDVVASDLPAVEAGLSSLRAGGD